VFSTMLAAMPNWADWPLTLLCRISGGLVAFEPIADAFEAENVGVVHDSVDHGGGDGLVAEDLAPAAGCRFDDTATERFSYAASTRR
jgi:hypothetical protein